MKNFLVFRFPVIIVALVFSSCSVNVNISEVPSNAIPIVDIGAAEVGSGSVGVQIASVQNYQFKASIGSEVVQLTKVDNYTFEPLQVFGTSDDITQLSGSFKMGDLETSN